MFELKKNRLIKKFMDFGFPKNEWLIFGGFVLAIHGIRDSFDLDIMVSPSLFRILQNHKDFEVITTDHSSGLKLKKYEIEIFEDILPLQFNFTESLLQTEDIEGVNVSKLSFVKNWKVMNGRKKDIDDVMLITDYIIEKWG